VRALDSRWTFFVLAAAMVALTLAVTVPFVWRGLRRDAATGGARWRSWLAASALVLGLPALTFGLYSLRGDVGALGRERAALSEQWLDGRLPAEGEASERLYAELERYLQRQPSDPRALVLKARLDMRAQRYDEAVAAFGRAVAGKSLAANDAGVWVEYAEARGMAQGGMLVGEPLQLVQKALSIDAHHAQALDLAGSASWEVRDFAKAATYWKRLLEQIPSGSSRHAELSLAIERAEQRARLSLPSTP
jgi:cytochrome c-type biogenesis protein CcmH